MFAITDVLLQRNNLLDIDQIFNINDKMAIY